MSFSGTLITYLASAALVASAASYVTHRVDDGAYQKLVAATAEASANASQIAAEAQKAQDATTLAAALTEAQAQQRLALQHATIIQKVPIYVTAKQDSSTCVTYGLVRLHDAAALSVDPASLQLPAGKSDDDCTPLKASALATGIVDNYAAANANAEELTGLQAYEKARQAVPEK